MHAAPFARRPQVPFSQMPDRHRMAPVGHDCPFTLPHLRSLLHWPLTQLSILMELHGVSLGRCGAHAPVAEGVVAVQYSVAPQSAFVWHGVPQIPAVASHVGPWCEPAQSAFVVQRPHAPVAQTCACPKRHAALVAIPASPLHGTHVDDVPHTFAAVQALRFVEEHATHLWVVVSQARVAPEQSASVRQQPLAAVQSATGGAASPLRMSSSLLHAPAHR